MADLGLPIWHMQINLTIIPCSLYLTWSKTTSHTFYKTCRVIWRYFFRKTKQSNYTLFYIKTEIRLNSFICLFFLLTNIKRKRGQDKNNIFKSTQNIKIITIKLKCFENKQHNCGPQNTCCNHFHIAALKTLIEQFCKKIIRLYSPSLFRRTDY